MEKAWESYRKCLPPNAPPSRVTETRQAFYGGAAVLFEAMVRMADADMQRMADIQLELHEFGQQLDRRDFGKQEH